MEGYKLVLSLDTPMLTQDKKKKRTQDDQAGPQVKIQVSLNG